MRVDVHTHIWPLATRWEKEKYDRNYNSTVAVYSLSREATMRRNHPRLHWAVLEIMVVVLLATAVACGPGTSPETDREALSALYHATDGPKWLNNRSWLSPAPMDDWYGVTTNRRGRVTELHLGGNEMSGRIPRELGNLDKLKILDIGDMQSTDNEGSDAGKFTLTIVNLVTVFSPPHPNDLTGCIPTNLRRQLKKESVLDGLPFCDEADTLTSTSDRVSEPRTEGATAPPSATTGFSAKHRPWPTSPLASATIEVCGGHDDLIRAIWSGNPANVHCTLRELNPDVNARGDNGNPALFWAILEDNSEIVRILVNAGADVNARDDNGNPALFWAILEDNSEIVQILVDAEADVNAKDGNGRSMLYWAKIKDNAEIAGLLTGAGAKE